MATCKLCRQDKPLIKKSHIVPDFLYQDLFDENHQFYLISNKSIQNHTVPKRKIPTGEYEGGILCADCDNVVIGGYESYSAKTLYAKGALPPQHAPKVTNFKTPDGIIFSKCENVDYKNYKLFLLSILWRASISTRPMFQEINLGPHEERIRAMLISGDPGEEDDYPFQVWTTVNDQKIPKDFILQPRLIKQEGHTLYIFPVAGMIIFFYISSHSKPSHVIENTIKKNCSFNMIHLPEGKFWTFFFKYLQIRKT